MAALSDLQPLLRRSELSTTTSHTLEHVTILSRVDMSQVFMWVHIESDSYFIALYIAFILLFVSSCP